MGIFDKLLQGGGKKSKRGSDSKRDVPPELDVRIKDGGNDKKRMKAASKRPAAAESAEAALGFSVRGTREGGKEERRQSYRVSYSGLVCRINELQKVVRVRDVSAGGVGLLYRGKRIKAGTRLHVVLGLEGKALVKGLTMRVVRHDEGVLGGEFENLERSQEDVLNHIVLEAQKRRKEKSESKAQ